MKKLILFVLIGFIAGNCYAVDLNYTMTNNNADRIVAMLKSFEDTLWAEIKADNAGWSDYLIAKETIRRILVRNLRRHEASVAGINAKAGVIEDDGAIQ